VTGVHIPSGPGYQVPLAESVATGAHVRVSTVGCITEPRQAAEIVSSGRADAVGLGREMLRDRISLCGQLRNSGSKSTTGRCSTCAPGPDGSTFPPPRA